VLYVRIANDDLAAHARIRNAAVELFGRDGFGVGLRAIADAAGVSLGLIRHHFGSKEELRAACDAYVLEEIRALKEEQATSDNPATTMLTRMAEVEELGSVVQYLTRALSDGGPLAREFLERMVADAEDYVTHAVENGLIVPSVDEKARARFLTLAVVGGMQLDAVLSDSPPWESWRRWAEWSTLPALELYTQGLLADRRMLEAYMTYMKDPPADTPGA